MKKSFFSWISEHLHKNSDAILLLCDLGYPEALPLLERFPDRVLNVGVSEQNAALVAKGLCSQNFEVFLYGISSFTLWRCAEALKLYFTEKDRFRLVGNGGGFGYGLMGTTHHSIDDLGLVSLWPAWTSWIPAYDQDVPEVLQHMTSTSGPQYLRLTNNSRESTTTFSPLRTCAEGNQLTIVTAGPLLNQVLDACKGRSDAQIFSVGCWPLDLESVQKHFTRTQRLLVIEEHQSSGGLANQLRALLDGPRKNITSLNVALSQHVGSRDYLLGSQGLSAEEISKVVHTLLEGPHDNH